jgi:ubiquinone/menaquinone biosynthesis C-methylase UbiE
MKQRENRFVPKALRGLFSSWGNSMIPPKAMRFVGKGDFEKIGNEFREHFIRIGKLQPGDQVLDVGCGIGRMAIPLTDYLSPAGEYHGFDIVKKGIDWCQERITPRFPNFHFLQSDVYNKHYNPDGKMRAADYVFPFADGKFDFVFLTSVFTHMIPADLENYLKEISRVMKPGGRCLITMFLLNDESRRLVGDGKSDLDFRHDMGGYVTTRPEDPETAIAYDEPAVAELFARYGLVVEQPFRYGSWCGRPEFLSYQDVVIAERR